MKKINIQIIYQCFIYLHKVSTDSEKSQSKEVFVNNKLMDEHTSYLSYLYEKKILWLNVLTFWLVY